MLGKIIQTLFKIYKNMDGKESKILTFQCILNILKIQKKIMGVYDFDRRLKKLEKITRDISPEVIHDYLKQYESSHSRNLQS